MRNQKTVLLGFGTIVFMLLLILDAKTALTGASEGIEICVRTVIPSLFPFFLLSGILTSCFTGRSVRPLRQLGKVCAIPKGFEYLLLIGLTGGYPVGAQCIKTACDHYGLEKKDAQRLLAFCNNAGPAFIFGMTGLLFPTPAAPWAIWGIQILCALVTGSVLPATISYHNTVIQSPSPISLSQAMQNALKAMASVCGWVIIFRVMISILNRWVLWLISKEQAALLLGFLELTNGCILLNDVQNIAVRFIASAVTTVFGGLCVYLQTVSVCGQLSARLFLCGKLIQMILAIPLSMLAAGVLFPGNKHLLTAGIILTLGMMLVIIFIKIKNHTGNSVLYRV